MSESISGVVLAAGYSSRAGAYKLTCAFAGSTVIERCIDGMVSVCDMMIVVCGYQNEKLAFLPGKYANLTLVYNAHYPCGMFSSVCVGLSAATGERVFILPGDHPLISSGVYRKMLQCPKDVVVPVYCGKMGHPALLSRKAVGALLESHFDTLRDFIRAYGFTGLDVDDPGVLMDFDTQEDYRAMLSLLGNPGGNHDIYHHRPN